MLEVGADQQKILRYWTKYAFFRIIYSLSIFSLGCIKTPWVSPKFGTVFSAFIVDEDIYFVCRYVFEPFRSYALPIDGGSAKFDVCPCQYLGVG